jgi:glyoxylase-like metal-dependent hydrolase (beta-lactamase superfamily II)
MTDGDVVVLCDQRLYALTNPYPVDGPVSTHPLEATGFAPMNVYVLIEGTDVLIVDTGWSFQELVILEQLRGLVPPDARLSILLTRPGELNSICNVRSIAEHFPVQSISAITAEAAQWMDFRPEYAKYGSTDIGALAAVESRQVRAGDEITVGGSRRLTLLAPPLRLIPTCWIYDHDTRTLFTSDSFTHALAASPGGPWIVTDPDSAGADQLYQHLTGSRSWWLPGAKTTFIAQALKAVFERYEVDAVAPGYGCIFVGPDVVRAQYRTHLDVLATAAR